jgi:hypothetical protein
MTATAERVTKKTPKRRIIRKGDVIVTFVEEEMEACVCTTCIRPFCVTVNLANRIRSEGKNLYCPVGHLTKPTKRPES